MTTKTALITAGGSGMAAAAALTGFIDSLPEKEEFRAHIPLGRCGREAEIAETIAFLAVKGGVDGGITRSV